MYFKVENFLNKNLLPEASDMEIENYTLYQIMLFFELCLKDDPH